MKYTLKFKFETLKVNTKTSMVSGNGGLAETDFETHFTKAELDEKTDDLKSIAYESIKDIPKVKKLGRITNIIINEIIENE